MEDIAREPILKSQVLPLLQAMDEMNFHLITIDSSYTKDFIFQEKNIHHYKFKKRKSVIIQLITILKTINKVISREDIIHVRSYPPMLIALLLKISKGNVVIFDPRGLWPEEVLLQYNRKIPFLIMKVLEILFVSISDEIIVVSNNFKRYLQNRYLCSENKLHIIPTFFGTSSNRSLTIKESEKLLAFKSFVNDSDFVFCYTGSSASYQMIKETMSFFSLVLELIPNSKIVVISKNLNHFKTYSLSENSKRVKLISLKQHEMEHYLSLCNYGLILREKHIVNKVSSPIKVKEYVSCGVKLITTQEIGDIEITLKKYNCGVVLKDFKEKTMIELINQIKQGLISKITDESIDEFKKNNSLQEVKNKTIKIYKKYQNEC